MQNLSFYIKSRFAHKILTICALFCLSLTVSAGTDMQADATLSLDQSINSPAVPQRYSAAIQRHMYDIGNKLAEHNIEVKYLRKREVLGFSVAASDLFAPNDTALSIAAPHTLNALSKIVQSPQCYKVLVVVHSDDTGSDTYAYNLTEARAMAVVGYYEEKFKGQDLNISAWGLGKDEFIDNDNTSVAKRAKNRRVEFIIVPDEGLVTMAKNGRL